MELTSIFRIYCDACDDTTTLSIPRQSISRETVISPWNQVQFYLESETDWHIIDGRMLCNTCRDDLRYSGIAHTQESGHAHL